MGKLILLLALIPALAFGAGETVKHSGTTILLDDGWFGTGWGDANDAITDDGFYAYTGTSGLRFDIGNWERFEVPQNSRIHGVEVCAEAKVEDNCSAINPRLSMLVSQDGGSTYSVAKVTSNLTNAAFQTVCTGHSGERWEKLGFLGANPTFDWRPENFNNETDYAVRIQATWKTPITCMMGYSFSINVEWVYTRVHYTVADDPILHQKVRKWRH